MRGLDSWSIKAWARVWGDARVGGQATSSLTKAFVMPRISPKKQAALAVAIKEIPLQESVSANTNLVPWLASRPVLVSSPHTIKYQEGNGIQKYRSNCSWSINLEYFASTFPKDQKILNKSLSRLEENRGNYAVYSINDGNTEMQKDKARSKVLTKEFNLLIIEFSSQNDAPKWMIKSLI